MIAYLAGPMDYCDPGETEAPRTNAVGALKRAGFASYDPTGAYQAATTDPAAVLGMNDAAIERCDALLAVWPPAIMSVGTPYEIFLAHRLGKPVAVVGPTRSMQLTALEIPVYELNETEEAAQYLAGRARGHEVAAPTDGAHADSDGDTQPLLYVGEEENGPARQHADDAGFDVFASESIRIPGHGFADIPLGIRVQLPAGTWGMLTGRSSTIRNRGLMVSQGVIDGGYRGPMWAGCWNLNPEDHLVSAGERIAQLIILPLFRGTADQATTLSDTDRGAGGFGSTGT